MSQKTSGTLYVLVLILTSGQQAIFDRPADVDRSLQPKMKRSPYPTPVTWSNNDQLRVISQAIWQDMTTTNPSMKDTTERSLIIESSASWASVIVEESPKSISSRTSRGGRSFGSPELTSLFSDMHGDLVVNDDIDLNNNKKRIDGKRFNCTHLCDIPTIHSESKVRLPERPQSQVTPGNEECTLYEQSTVDSGRTLLNITNPIYSDQNQQHLLREHNKETEYVLSSPSSRVTEESAETTNNIMGPPIIADLLGDSQKDGDIREVYFALDSILLPYCSESSSCQGRCDEYPNRDVDDKERVSPNQKNSIIGANFQNSSLLRLSYGTSAQVNLSSSTYTNVCLDDRSSSNICNCDQKCVIYGDCCPDVFHVCWDLYSGNAIESFIKQAHNDGFNNSNHKSIIKELRQNTSTSHKILDHLYANFGSCQIFHGIYYRRMMFVNRCPDLTDTSLKHKCELPDDINLPPVTAKLGSVSVEFSNMFCAECHGVLQEEYEMWATILICDHSLIAAWFRVLVFYDIDFLMKYKLCNLTFSFRVVTCQRRPCMVTERLTPQQEQQVQLGVDNRICTWREAILCRSYYFKIDNYRNPHCRKCLQHSNRQKRDVWQAIPTTPLITPHNLQCYHDSVDNKPPRPLEGVFLILDISGSRKYYRPSQKLDPALNTNIDSANCSLSDIFDSVSQTCRPLLCPLGRIPELGQCVPSKIPTTYINSMSQALETRLNVSIWTYSENISCQLIMGEFLEEGLRHLVLEDGKIYVHGLKNHSTDRINEDVNKSSKQPVCTELERKIPTHNNTVVEIKLTLNDDSDLQTWRAVETFAEHFFPEEYNMTILSNRDFEEFLCASGTEAYHFTSFKIEEENGTLQAQIIFLEHELLYPMTYVAYRRSFVKVGNMTEDLTTIISVCEVSRLLLKHGCFVTTFTLNSTSMNISQIHRQYGEANVDIQGNKVYTCLQKRSSRLSLSEAMNPIFYIVHWIMAGISMLCLVIMLSLYCVFSELLTLPGKMTASLAATMLLTLVSNSLTFAHLHHRYVCPVAGAVSHVVVLAQFGWMSVIAFNMALTFGPSTLNWARSPHDKTFLKYNILVWGVSLVLVLISVILDVLHKDPANDEGSNPCSNARSVQIESTNFTTSCSSQLNVFEFPRYGWPHCTWFSGPVWTQLAFVVIPYAITFVINMVCFTVTLYGLHKSSKQVQKLGKRSNSRIKCIIYIKLSTAMGFTCVLSFLRNFTQNSQALTYFCMTMILLQGMFLFFAFMINRRLFFLVKNRIRSREKSLKTSTALTARG